ncbi:MAG: S41 family peptidase [Verrucomicrobia bacterium]|nr:S41 family peptidase [Verrucomicrobiota bacterium]
MQLLNHYGKNRRLLSTLCFCAAFVVTAFAEDSQPSQEYLIGARLPALSPDGKTLAFVYRGDIWSVPSEGGRATPLTLHVDMDSDPVWSPDGKWIAFSSTRNGNSDIFVMPSQGGSPRQLTFSSEAEAPSGWSPDSSEILFSAKRDGKGPGIFSVNLDLVTKKYAEDYPKLYFPAFSPDGKTIVYGRFGFPWIRPRYYGSGAMQINLMDVATSECKALVDDQKQHLWSQFMPSGQEILTVTIGERTPGVPTLSEIGSTNKFTDTPAMTPNLWKFNLQGEGCQLTQFTGDAVRAPSVAAATGDIAFEYDIDLYILRSGCQKAEKVLIQAAVDAKTNKRRNERFDSKNAEELAVSEDGATVFFGLRSEIWSIPSKKPPGVANRSANIAKRLTDWVGEDSNFVVAPGKNPTKLYFLSDRQKNLRLYELDLESDTVACLWDREEDILNPVFSPDGSAIAFWVSGPDGGLYRLNLESRNLSKLVSLPASYLYGNGGTTFSWSPDGRWIAYTQNVPRGARNIFVVGSEGGSPVNVTSLNAMHEMPTWSVDGKFLYFFSDRDGSGIYRLPLRENEAQLNDFDLKFEPSTNKVNVSIDFSRIDRRIIKHYSGTPSQMIASPTGDLVAILNGEVALISYDGKSIHTVTSGGGKGNLQIAPAVKKVYFTGPNGEIFGRLIQDNAPLEKVTFIADFERNVQDERQAAFAQFWRNFKRGFYDGNMHGRDWDAIRARYERLLPTIDTSEEFGVLLNRMTGELESSHSEIGTRREVSSPSPSTPKLGFIIDYTWRGPGLRIAEVPPNMPGDYEATRIKAGEYVMQINGKDVRADENLYQTINNKPNDFVFMVNSRPSTNDARLVKYSVPTSYWGSTLYENRIEKNINTVSKASDDRLAYVHISAMGSPNQIRFEREVYDRIQDKQGLIIDVRGNRGGNIADTLIGWLMRKPHGFVKPRDEAIRTVPDRSWDKPIIVLSDQEAFSNGELFTTAVRINKLGLVVGMPTPGYVIWTYGMGLVDGTSARMPLSGAWRLDGTPTEGMGEEPDIRVELTSEDYRLGRDPQLERAIHEILKQLDSAPSK